MKIPLHRLPSSVGGPSIDRSAEKALKLLDRDLVVFFSRYYVTPDCKIAMTDRGEPLGEWPRFHVALWSWLDDRFYKIATIQTPEMEFAPFDMRIVKALQSDVMRVKGLKGAIEFRAEERERKKEAAKKQLASDRRDWQDENKAKIGEALTNPHHRYATHRPVKTFGFSGQRNKDTSNKLVKKSAEELGWRANEALTGRK